MEAFVVFTLRYGRVWGMGADSVRSTVSFKCVCESLCGEKEAQSWAQPCWKWFEGCA